MINNVNVQETEEKIEKFRMENKYFYAAGQTYCNS